MSRLARSTRNLREDLQNEIKRIHRELGTTFIYVTHDQHEALALSDRIAVFRDGAIEQLGTPTEIYGRPQTVFVAQFVGDFEHLPRRSCALGIGSRADDSAIQDPFAGDKRRRGAGGRSGPAGKNDIGAVSTNTNAISGTLVDQVYLGSTNKISFRSKATASPVHGPGDLANSWNVAVRSWCPGTSTVVCFSLTAARLQPSKTLACHVGVKWNRSGDARVNSKSEVRDGMAS